MQEPTYDPDLLKTDKAYQYSMVDTLIAYMESLPDYADQVCYFLRMCEAIDVEPPMLNMGSRVIFDGECWSGYGEGKPVDKEGYALKQKTWGLPAYDDNQKMISKRLYFTNFYKGRCTYSLGFALQSFEERKTRYIKTVSNSLNPEAFIQSELRQVQRTIDEYQNTIDSWNWEQQFRIDPKIKQQFRQATQLIEDELNGTDAIKWNLFLSTSHLNPFALLWDVVRYKRLLEQQISKPLSNPNHSAPLHTSQKNKGLETTSTYNLVEQKPPVVFIREVKREEIIRALSFDLDSDNKKRLTALLGLTIPDAKINTKTKAKYLADYFRQVYDAQDIDNSDYSKDDVGEWLAYWFVKPNGVANGPQSFKDYLQLNETNSKLLSENMPNKIKYKRQSGF